MKTENKELMRKYFFYKHFLFLFDHLIFSVQEYRDLKGRRRKNFDVYIDYKGKQPSATIQKFSGRLCLGTVYSSFFLVSSFQVTIAYFGVTITMWIPYVVTITYYILLNENGLIPFGELTNAWFQFDVVENTRTMVGIMAIAWGHRFDPVFSRLSCLS